MRLLLLTAIGSCAVLLLGIGMLWWKLRRLGSADAAPIAHKPPARARVHPRLDLAAGKAPPAQTVRIRQRGQGLRRQGAGLAETPLQRRGDRAWHNPSYGDLRDPNLGQAPAGGVLRPIGSLGKRER